MTATSPHTPLAPKAGQRLAGLRVILVGPSAAQDDGIAAQPALLATGLQMEGASVVRVATNPRLPGMAELVPVVGDVLRRARFRALLERAIGAGADVLHVQGEPWQEFWDFTAYALRQAKLAGMRTVLRWDGGDTGRFLASDPRGIRSALSYADRVIVPSGYLRGVFRSRLGMRARMIPSLVDDPGVERPPARRQGRLRLLCARPLEACHGIDVVLAAASQAVEMGVDLQLVIAGEGPERSRLGNLALARLGDRASFLGGTSRERLHELLRETDVLVDGSWADECPAVLAEALAAGVPVAATNAGAIPWIVEDGSTGFLTPPGDALALAESIANFDADRDALAGFAWRAKINALRWTWDALRDYWSAVHRARRTA